MDTLSGISNNPEILSGIGSLRLVKGRQLLLVKQNKINSVPAVNNPNVFKYWDT